MRPGLQSQVIVPPNSTNANTSVNQRAPLAITVNGFPNGMPSILTSRFFNVDPARIHHHFRKVVYPYTCGRLVTLIKIED